MLHCVMHKLFRNRNNASSKTAKNTSTDGEVMSNIKVASFLKLVDKKQNDHNLTTRTYLSLTTASDIQPMNGVTVPTFGGK